MIRKNFLLSRSHALRSAGVLSVAAAAVVAGINPANAQQTEIEALREQIKLMQQRLDDLAANQDTLAADTKKVADAAAKTPPVTTRSGIGVNVSALLQVQANSYNNESGPTFPRQQDSFRLRRGEIRLTAPKITDRISGTVMFDVARGISGNNGQATPSNLSFGGAVLQELQLSYLLKKATAPNTDNIFIDAGQFKIPFGYEGDLVSSSAIQTIERALMFRARDLASGGYGDVRDTGAQIRGSFSDGQIAYWLGAFNGLGERQNQQASGDPKAIVARVAWRPKSIQGFQAGLSYAQGNTRLTPQTDGGATTVFDRNLWNAFAAYKRDKWTLQGEYTQAEGENVTSATRRKPRGYYGHVGYLFTPKIEGIFRYDTFDFDREFAGETEVKELTAGINYYIKGNNAKIQANVVRVNGVNSSPVSSAFRNERTEFRLQGQVAF